MPVDVEALKSRLAHVSTLATSGRVLGVIGLGLRFTMPGVRIGDVVRVRRRGEPLECEVVAFAGAEAIAMPLGALTGVGPDDVVEPTPVRADRKSTRLNSSHVRISSAV